MNEEVIIRKAKEEDFKQLHRLIMQVHKIHVEERRDMYKDVNPLNFEEFKNELIDKKVVGLCFSQIKKISNNKIMKDREILNIIDICVDKDERRKGIGKKLYSQVLQIGKGKNIDSIELMVWGFNKDAIKFYEKIGMNIKNLRFEQKIK